MQFGLVFAGQDEGPDAVFIQSFRDGDGMDGGEVFQGCGSFCCGGLSGGFYGVSRRGSSRGSRRFGF